MAQASGKPEKNLNDELSITEKLNEFLQKNRIKLVIGLAAVLVILAGFVIFNVVSDKIKSNAFTAIDDLNRRYEALKPLIGSETDSASGEADITALLEDLDGFSKKNSGFAAARSYSLMAGIYWDKKNWAEAEKAWSASAKAAGKSYLAPVSLYNAAMAAEEQGDINSAIDLLNSALGYGSDFPAAAKAQFSIGRLEESRDNKSAALEAYHTLVSKWPGDQVWANLAQNRIIVLSE